MIDAGWECLSLYEQGVDVSTEWVEHVFAAMMEKMTIEDLESLLRRARNRVS